MCVAELLLLSPGRSPARLRRFVRLRSSCFRRHSSLSGWSSGSWQSEPVPLGARELFYSPLLLLFPLQLIRSKDNGFHMIDGSIKRIRCKKYHKTITDCCIADAFWHCESSYTWLGRSEVHSRLADIGSLGLLVCYLLLLFRLRESPVVLRQGCLMNKWIGPTGHIQTTVPEEINSWRLLVAESQV